MTFGWNTQGSAGLITVAIPAGWLKGAWASRPIDLAKR